MSKVRFRAPGRIPAPDLFRIAYSPVSWGGHRCRRPAPGAGDPGVQGLLAGRFRIRETGSKGGGPELAGGPRPVAGRASSPAGWVGSRGPRGNRSLHPGEARSASSVPGLRPDQGCGVLRYRGRAASSGRACSCGSWELGGWSMWKLTLTASSSTSRSVWPPSSTSESTMCFRSLVRCIGRSARGPRDVRHVGARPMTTPRTNRR